MISSVCLYLKCSICSSSHNQRVIQCVKKTFCFVKICFNNMYNHKPKSNAHLRKKHKIADRKGGGLTLTVSLTVKYPFFFWRLPLAVLRPDMNRISNIQWEDLILFIVTLPLNNKNFSSDLSRLRGPIIKGQIISSPMCHTFLENPRHALRPGATLDGSYY